MYNNTNTIYTSIYTLVYIALVHTYKDIKSTSAVKSTNHSEKISLFFESLQRYA